MKSSKMKTNGPQKIILSNPQNNQSTQNQALNQQGGSPPEKANPTLHHTTSHTPPPHYHHTISPNSLTGTPNPSSTTIPPPSPPPKTPLPPLPPYVAARGEETPFHTRVLNTVSVRRSYVQTGLQLVERQMQAQKSGNSVPRPDSSTVSLDDFRQEFSNVGGLERYCVCDWVEDPNVCYARPRIEEMGGQWWREVIDDLGQEEELVLEKRTGGVEEMPVGIDT